MALNLESSVGDFVTALPGRARVFEEFELDYCCGGKTSLAEACRAQGIDAQAVLDRLLACPTGPSAADSKNWGEATLAELVDHILDTHHAFLKAEFPRLTKLIPKVVAAHGQGHPELAELQATFMALVAELEEHMAKEEQILFPQIRQLETASGPLELHCGSVENPIRVMESEHESAREALVKMRGLTQGYAPPADACESYRALLQGLAELEADLHRHIHKENHNLFPRSIAAERALADAS